jgi:uncharacterized protein (TIGR02646 family)
MIRVRKPAQPPQVLRTKGKARRRSLEREYSKDPASYDSGAKTFTFDSGIYAHPDVKSALTQAQHGKCAFCESKVTHISYGDVEHFRPKAGWRQSDKRKLNRPGYYWLAYEWSNLLLACTLCNQRFKGNFFPLKKATQRARNHLQDVAAEEPLVIDPSVDDPESFISFRQEVPYAIAGNARGRATIKNLGLDRAALAESRRDRLAHIQALRTIVELGDPQMAAEARNKLDQLKGDAEQYASMTRAFLR